MQATATIVTTTRHPLDPLGADEIEAAAAILRRERGLGDEARFISIALQEPPKAAVLAGESAGIEREAFVILRDRAARTTYEAVVSLTAAAVRSWREAPGMQPSITIEEALLCDAAVKADPIWQAAMRKRGVTSFELAMIDAWSAGNYGDGHGPERRLVRALTWVRTSAIDNGYARPVEGLLTLFDLDEMTVAEVVDHGVVPLPPNPGNYDAEGIRDPSNVPHFDGLRNDLKPVEIHQPEGTSFAVDGHEVRWQKWRLRLGFTPREGLVLHSVGYEDGGRLRPILYRAALSEMVVPYGDPNPTHWRKNAFDEGEYGLGMCANSLELGCDCLGEIRYFDAVLADGAGRALTLPNAICMHEEDFGLLWKHRDLRAGTAEARRARRLVISFIATVGNYEYGFYWYLYQDGSIQFEIKMTGIASTGAVAPGEQPRYGELLAPGLYGPNHQHFFNVRLDTMIDGPNNSVVELNSEAVPAGPENPNGNAWLVRATPLRTEQQAQRTMSLESARVWKVINSSVKNRFGEPVGYRLQPGENALPFAQPGSSIIRRAGFITRHLWVTPYDPSERYAAGDYPNQHAGGAGLPAYTAANRPIEDTDVVLWYTLGAHHVVRPEEWPVMPVHCFSFRLIPSGFFDGNPALDVPPAMQHGEGCHTG